MERKRISNATWRRPSPSTSMGSAGGRGNHNCLFMPSSVPKAAAPKEESETEFTEDSVGDDGPVGTEKASSVLVVALESLSQALMDDGGITKEIVAAVHASLHPGADQDGITKNVMATLDAFLCPKEDGDGLLSKITSFDAQLITGRDRILRTSV